MIKSNLNSLKFFANLIKFITWELGSRVLESLQSLATKKMQKFWSLNVMLMLPPEVLHESVLVWTKGSWWLKALWTRFSSKQQQIQEKSSLFNDANYFWPAKCSKNYIKKVSPSSFFGQINIKFCKTFWISLHAINFSRGSNRIIF